MYTTAIQCVSSALTACDPGRNEWAQNSPNKDVKLYIGAPASENAANTGSYVPVDRLAQLWQETKSNYSSLGGVMLWDARWASESASSSILLLIGFMLYCGLTAIRLDRCYRWR